MRKENEPFEVYKKRRKEQNEKDKIYLKGRIVWRSREWGTYVKKRDGELKNKL